MRGLQGISVRVCAILLVVACMWTLIGAPLTSQQWQAVPLTLRRMLLQIPGRMKDLLVHWHSSGSIITDALAETGQSDLQLLIWDSESQCQQTIALEDYVQGVVAAEMPAQYAPEALKCQAIAARTRAVYACRALGGNGCQSNPSCDLCTSAACCQAYADQTEQKTRWRDEYSVYAARTSNAVTATAGQILTYGGLPIQVLYHANSGGMTEDAQEVFSESLPYLTSVPSPGEEASDAYEARVTYTCEEVAARLLAAFPDCGISAEGLAGQLRLQASTASGRVSSVLAGKQTVSGRAFREALNLRSTWISWEADDSTITFSTRGYGHGVGMSQDGAQAMASTGQNCQEILQHYYPGTRLSLLPVMHEETSDGS